MGNVTSISSHPRYVRKIPMEITFTYDWSGFREDDPKQINFLRIGRTEEEYQTLMQRYADRRELENE